MQGTVIDSKYQIVRRLGQGGMGTVYEARHLGTGRRVALKVIVQEVLAGGGDILERFRREARASGVIESQHVVQVLDTGVDPETKTPYLVMEHLTGEDLAEAVARLVFQPSASRERTDRGRCPRTPPTARTRPCRGRRGPS